MLLVPVTVGVFTICAQVKTPVSAMPGALTVKVLVALRMGTVKVDTPLATVVPMVW